MAFLTEVSCSDAVVLEEGSYMDENHVYWLEITHSYGPQKSFVDNV